MMLYTGKVMPAESRIVPSVKGDLRIACDTEIESARSQHKKLSILKV